MEDREAAAAILASAIGGVAAASHPAIAVTLAAVQPWMPHVVELVSRDRQARMESVLAMALPDKGSATEVEKRLQEDPLIRELLVRVVKAAQDCARDDKLRALSRCLRAAWDDSARVDEELVLTSAVDQLDGPHIKLLATIATQDSTTRPALSGAHPGHDQVLDALLGVLTATGLVQRRPGTNVGPLIGLPMSAEDRYLITPLGQLLILRLGEAEGGSS